VSDITIVSLEEQTTNGHMGAYVSQAYCHVYASAKEEGDVVSTLSEEGKG
jgi:hypothetical protein